MVSVSESGIAKVFEIERVSENATVMEWASGKRSAIVTWSVKRMRSGSATDSGSQKKIGMQSRSLSGIGSQKNSDFGSACELNSAMKTQSATGYESESETTMRLNSETALR